MKIINLGGVFPGLDPLFGGSPFSTKQPKDTNGRGERRDFCVILYKDCGLEVASCQSPFWRLKLSLGALIERRGDA